MSKGNIPDDVRAGNALDVETPDAAALGSAPADRLVAYLQSCSAGQDFTVRAPVPESGSAVALIDALSAQQRGHFARSLLELAIVSMGVAREPGDFIPKVFPLDIDQYWMRRVEKLKDEFVAYEGEHGPHARIVDRLNRELLLAPSARTRALRCLRLALQLAPEMEEIEFALLVHRASRSADREVVTRLKSVATSAASAALQARAWLMLGALQMRKQQLRRGLMSLDRCLQLAPMDADALVRICYIYLKLGEEKHASAALVKIANLLDAGEPGAVADAMAFVKSPASRFPRLLIGNPAVTTAVRKHHPQFIFSILEAAQRSQVANQKQRRTHPSDFVRRLRQRARVAFCGMVVELTPGQWVCIQSSSVPRYAVTQERIVENLASGGPGGVIALAREIGESAMAIATDANRATFLTPRARGAIAVAIEAIGMPPSYLIFESDWTMAIEPPLLCRWAEDAVGPLCTLWVARQAMGSGAASPG